MVTLVLLCLPGIPFLGAGTLAPGEIGQMESAFGITLSEDWRQELGRILKPDGPAPQWRLDAEARIEQHRKANLEIKVVSSDGEPVKGATVEARLKRNAFTFGGVMSVKDFHDTEGRLGVTKARYRELFLQLYNAAGLDNGLKAKLRRGNEDLLPEFFDWAAANSLPVRGHLLIWPGNENNNHLPADILEQVEEVEAAIRDGVADATVNNLKATLKANVDALIAEWAGKWKVYEWDVINEPIGNHRVQDLLGYDQMAGWFRIGQANAVDPACEFLINEFQIISAKPPSMGTTHYLNRSASYKQNISRVLAEGGPLTRIGFQSRFKWDHPDPAVLYARLEDFGNTYGLEMVGTEFEITDHGDRGGMDYSESLRAQMTEEILTTYFSHPLVTGLNVWSFMRAEPKAMCLYDGSVKLNALAWYYLHRIRYHTEASAQSDVDGRVVVRGFKGDYDVTVRIGEQTFEAFPTLHEDTVIEVPIPSAILGPDTDQDGLFDTIDPDDDGDLLPDTFESMVGFNPLVAESDPDPDQDGLHSLVEFATGLDPSSPGQEAPLTLEPGTGRQFRLVVRERRNLDGTGLMIVLETSASLESWVKITGYDFPAAGILVDDATTETVQDTFGEIERKSFLLSPFNPPFFFRLVVRRADG